MLTLLQGGALSSAQTKHMSKAEPTLLTLLAVLLGVAALIVLVRRDLKRESQRKAEKIKAAFAGREPLSPEAFYERYFLELGVAPNIVGGVRSILEEHLDADLSQLVAEDDFSKNLSFFWDFDSMANAEIVVALERHFQIKISDAEAEQTFTVLDLVQLVARKRAQASQQTGGT